jgi:hypothetical protein
MVESRHSVPTGRSRLRGAAVPAALVSVSVLLVLIVVMVSSLMGNGGSERIPVAGPSPANADQGQVLDGQTQAGPDASASVATVASRAASPKSAPPTVGATKGVPAPAPPGFSPLSVEAESATLSPASGHPSPYPCPDCSGGSRVRFVGRGKTVTFKGVSVPVSAIYHLTIAYELDGSRSFFVSVNGGSSTEVPCTGTNWNSPTTITVAIVLRAGTNSITFGNPSTDAPDLDKITIGP